MDAHQLQGRGGGDGVALAWLGMPIFLTV